ncbi:uncharacterized protein LOC125843202 [Solanum stenotomum]|uniref:uncharacterized protein LOC125843202 n=1 Tax=Solanum stenotomum TaxID=172797 RepID=UPI0020D01EA8|nr:uncharacterized protein LOC125843202 [Solanum stenotomum]
MDQACSNQNGKIWIFWNADIQCQILENEDQHITCELNHVECKEKYMISFIYAKCKDHLRRPFWDKLMQLSDKDIPWCTMGDFNMITSIEEKQGGVPYNMNKSFDFLSVIEACGLMDLGYSGHHFTWCNQRATEARVWKRLDRAMTNNKWLEHMPQTTITHLPAVGSDHNPLLMEIAVRRSTGQPNVETSPKMKRLASTLSNLSRREFGDIFTVITEYEEQVRQAEEEGDENIAKAACVYFQETFTGHENRIAENILQCPDGFRGMFYQACWDIIQDELLEAVLAYFSGHIMPKFMSHSCLLLLPKVEHPNRLNEFRPISLSNFTNKTISKILCLRLAPILPHLISENQSGFVRGRSISENIMLAQEITHNIKKPKEGDNVVIKLNMAKAYDRVSWSFTCLVLRAMGFGEVFIDLVWRTMSNNWYSVIVNGTRHCFFHST